MRRAVNGQNAVAGPHQAGEMSSQSALADAVWAGDDQSLHSTFSQSGNEALQIPPPVHKALRPAFCQARQGELFLAEWYRICSLLGVEDFLLIIDRVQRRN